MGTVIIAPDFRASVFARVVDLCLHAGKNRLLAVTALMIGGIVLADWRAGEDISLGVLYILPMMIAAIVLEPAGVIILAEVCAVLRWAFDNPHSHVEATLRFLFASVAYICSSLFVIALLRNRRLVFEHVDEMEQEHRLRRAAEEQLRVLVESSPAGILTLDEEGIVLAANRATRELFAIPESEALEGEAIRDYLPVLSDALDLAAGTEQFHTAAQCQGTRQNGEIFIAHTWFSTYKTGDHVRLAAIVVDASEEMREREESGLRQLARSSRITAAAVSHEIRNLCGAISLIYQNLKDKSSSYGDEDFQRFGGLVKGLERVASLELHSIAQESLDAIPLRPVLDNLRIVIEPNWQDIGGTVHWHFPAQIPEVLADEHGLLQAFLNLAQNSLRAVESCVIRELTIHVSQEESRVTIRFRDPGPGVTDPKLLFQPFQQGAQDTGIGLYVSRAILRSYGGELRYEPIEKGACFAVELQVAQTVEQP